MTAEERAKLLAKKAEIEALLAQGNEKAGKNRAGVECQAKFTLDVSNRKIARHYQGKCGCGKSKKGYVYTCWLAKRDSRATLANRGIGLRKAKKLGLIS